MSKFKVGDRVRVVDGWVPKGVEGEVIDVVGDSDVWVKFNTFTDLWGKDWDGNRIHQFSVWLELVTECQEQPQGQLNIPCGCGFFVKVGCDGVTIESAETVWSEDDNFGLSATRAATCASLLRSVIAVSKMTMDEIEALINGDEE